MSGSIPLGPVCGRHSSPFDTDVESRIIRQQGDRWDRDLFENHLMATPCEPIDTGWSCATIVIPILPLFVEL